MGKTDGSDMLRTSLALAVCASAVAMVPTGSLTASMRLRPVAFRCSMSSAADDKNADMMLKLSLNQMESVKGLEGLPEKDANKAISAVKMAAGGEVAEKERKLLNSRRLHEIFIARRDERNEKLAFDTMFNSLQSLFGRDGFKGEDAERALREIATVEAEVSAEDGNRKKMMGSKRVYKFVRAATKTLSRPLRRRNHPGETWDGGAGHR